MIAALILALEIGGGTSPRDLLAFSAYAALALVVPGTLLWRLLREGRERPWLEDVVFGTILAYAVEIPIYVAARALGVPLLVLAWPLALYTFAVVTRRGRRAWRPQGTRIRRISPTWSWLLAGITAYLVLFVARASWWELGQTPGRLRTIGPDASFQLALTGELRHHVPPSVPWVAGEPLHYHWLTYAHTASATWLTGIEPVVVIGRLAPVVMMIVILLATALIASRWSGRPLVGPLAAALLVIVHSPAFSSTETDHFQRQEFTSQAIFGSPTMTFGLALFCGVLALTLEVLDGQHTRSTWPMLVLLLAATAGAKATFAPMVVAGVVAVVVVGLLTRSLQRRHLALLAVSAATWAVFQFGFYAGEDLGLKVSPRGTFDVTARSIGAYTPEPLSVAGAVMAGVILLLWAVHAAPMVGLLLQGGWRLSPAVFFFGFTASGFGASLVLDLGSFSQQWFVASTQVVVAVGAACGFASLVPRGSLRRMLPTAGIGALLGAVGMAVGWELSSQQLPPPGPTLDRLWDYAAPFLVTVLVLLSIAIAVAVVVPRLSDQGYRLGVLFLCAGLAGLGLFRTTQVTVAMLQVPWPRESLPAAQDTTVGRGGVATARWLRAHTGPDEVLATNGHTLTPNSPLPLAIWLAGHSERRVLIEGWGYTAKHSAEMLSEDLHFEDVQFWDPSRLRANDAVFVTPTEGNLAVLSERYSVQWLVLDRRFPSDADALSRLVQPSFSKGDYVVYQIR